jgi:hypothetical protein
MLKIDGTDIGDMGFCLVQGSYDSVFCYPKRSEVAYTDYAEKDGIRADLRKFETEPRSVTLKFGASHGSVGDFRQKYEDFYALVTSPGYREMDFGKGFTHFLRYSGTKSYEARMIYGSGGMQFSMDFIEDAPFMDSSVKTPSGSVNIPRGEYKVDGVDFRDFGVFAEAGATSEVLRYADTKPPFTDGRMYYTDTVRLKQREISLPLCMYASNGQTFVRNYQAFYNAFAKAGERSMYVKAAGGTLKVYYKGCGSYRIFWRGEVGARFRLNLTVNN